MIHRSLVMLIAVLALGACAAPSPTGPGVVATAGTDKSVAEFRQDDADCRQAAVAQLASAPAGTPTADTPQQRYDTSYAQCMCAKGDKIAQGFAAYPLVATGLLATIGASGGGHR
jgi:hypothetical protein